MDQAKEGCFTHQHLCGLDLGGTLGWAWLQHILAHMRASAVYGLNLTGQGCNTYQQEHGLAMLS